MIPDSIGMDFYYSDTGVVKDFMIKYLQKVLDKFPKELRGTSATLSVDYLFQVRGEDEVVVL